MKHPRKPRRSGLLVMSSSRWIASGILLLSYIGYALLLSFTGLDPLVLFPVSAIALSILFFEGLALWPVVLAASLAGCLFAGLPPAFCILMPLAQTLQAVAGSQILKSAHVDPLFRRSRDIFWMLGMILLVSLILPSFGALAQFADGSVSAATWGASYMGTIFSLLILVPFLLRWLAKPRFNRTWTETLGIAGVFIVLLTMDYLLFIGGMATLASIPFVYFLLIPLFWIALRLRPRFVSLALLLTSLFALASLYVGAHVPEPALVSGQLFQTQAFLIAIATIFLIITSLEENRRLNANLTRSQLGTLENAIARVSSESKSKNDFIAVLAHELRNPLAPIASAIDLLKLKEGRDPDELETLAMMEDRMQVIRRLLDDLLDISRISEGKIAIRTESVDLEAVIRRAMVSTQHHYSERHQALSFKAPKKPLIVSGDPVRLEQIVSNLLTNASKYSDSGDAVTMTLAEKDGQAELVIADEGLGIAPAVLEQVFMPFHQADNGSRSAKGLGIGLSLVRSFVEAHGGTVYASSEGVGRGSRFTVLLPLAADTSILAKTAEPKNASSAESVSRAKTGPLVLVVDDNDAAAWGIGKLLELRGCTVEYAYDGRQAIEQALSLSPAIVLLDLGLPDQSGHDVAKTMRARGYRGRLIALTGFSNEDARSLSRESGFEHYLVKPAGIADLRRVIPEIA